MDRLIVGCQPACNGLPRLPTDVTSVSPLWVSADFRRQYLSAQAIKLAIIDAAFEACVILRRDFAGDAVPA